MPAARSYRNVAPDARRHVLAFALKAHVRRRTYLRNVAAEDLFEDFLIAAVASILVIRAFLHLTGYPQIGGEGLHVAHMLWGGLLMLVALLLLLTYLGAAVKSLAAILGGIGFGTFIDELGKFLTHDNDYFFQPTAALIYLIFVLTWLGARALRRRPMSDEEWIANALEMTLEAVRHDLDPEERRLALEYLARAESRHAVARALADALRRVDVVERPEPGLVARTHDWLRARYAWLIARPWFAGALVTFFALHAVFTLLKSALYLIPAVRGAAGPQLPALSFFEWGDLLASAAPGVLVLIGIARLRRSRLAAYEMFQRAVLVILFVTEFFAFYHSQFLAVVGLGWNVLVFGVLRYAIREERKLRS